MFSCFGGLKVTQIVVRDVPGSIPCIPCQGFDGFVAGLVVRIVTGLSLNRLLSRVFFPISYANRLVTDVVGHVYFLSPTKTQSRVLQNCWILDVSNGNYTGVIPNI